MITKIEQDIKGKIKGRVLYDEPMSRHTSFRIGGPADIWIEPRNLDDLKCCVQLSSDKNIPLFVIGSGTNLLVKDEGIRGIVLNMRAPALRNIHRNGVGISAASSVTLGELLDFCSKEGFGGMEFLSGIPGTVGGAVAMNAGTRHHEIRKKWLSIGELIEEISVMDYSGRISLLGKNDLVFDYRSSNLVDYIILKVRFLLTEGAEEGILTECRRFLKRKKTTQELSLPSAGCVFKNPPDSGKSAGELIDECNLKGLKIGGAEISKKHANFIVNTGGARSADVIALIDEIKGKVKNRFGVELAMEIKIV